MRRVASADQLGVDPARLAALTAAIRAWPELGVHAVVMERGGHLVYEEYFDGFDERWGEALGRVTVTSDRRHGRQRPAAHFRSSGARHGCDDPCGPLQRLHDRCDARRADSARTRVSRREDPAALRLSRCVTVWPYKAVLSRRGNTRLVHDGSEGGWPCDRG